jgi:diguanylate cyclase (GGDEF)-like protein
MTERGFSFRSTTEFAKRYLIGICLVVSLIILSTFWGFNFRSNELFRERLINEGRSFFQEIVVTRLWIAQHGGVYVKMSQGVEVNPYLSMIPDLRVVIKDEKGESYTLKNPALVTREISRLASEKGIFKFNITSLKPINPANVPDPFEREALNTFNMGVKERHAFEDSSQGKVFRYMAPLIAEDSCLKCHAFQGYKKGDVRGGISVTIPAENIIRQIDKNRIYLTLSAVGIVLIIILIVYFISNFFMKDLRIAEQLLVDMASKDFLTGILNRREAFRRIEAELQRTTRLDRALSVIMTDIDHFKKINDTYGHLSGDIVLKTLSGLLMKTVREYDILCRYGGEEFVIVTPETNEQQAKELAERIRKRIEDTAIPLEGQPDLKITASLGVSQYRPGEKIEDLISRADQGLYEAKQTGRNRVCKV